MSIPTWIPLAGAVFGALFLLGRVQERRQGAGAGGVGQGGFVAVGGLEEAVEDLRELVAVLNDPKRYERLGAVAPRGALLVGPPGTGKTLLARSVAAEAGVPFHSANGSDFVEMYVGVGAKRIRELYDKARQSEKAIVFIDEIDAIARKRGAANDVATGSAIEHENTLLALLNELDGFSTGAVITIAATNRPDVLDPAVCRPGRLDRRVEVPTPDRKGRRAVLEVHTANKPLREVDLDAVAARTPGMSGAELARVCNEAALFAARRGLDRLDQSCFDEAVELVAMGRERRSAQLTDRDRRITAWHEAGHAVCALVHADAPDPVAVSIVPRGAAGGVTWMAGSEQVYATREQALAQLVVALGGRCGEERLLGGSCTGGAAADLEQATAIAATMVRSYGMTGRGLAVRTGADEASDEMVEVLLAEAHATAVDLLEANAPLFEAVVEALLEHGRVDRGELGRLAALHGTTDLRPAVVKVEPVPAKIPATIPERRMHTTAVSAGNRSRSRRRGRRGATSGLRRLVSRIRRRSRPRTTG